MNKELQTIGVWVKASERLPDNEGIVPIKTMSNENHGFYNKEEDKFYYRQYTEWTPFDSTDGDWKNKVSWLSEQQRILLTAEEWESVHDEKQMNDLVEKLYPDTSVEKFIWDGPHKKVSNKWASIQSEINRDRRCFIEGYKQALSQLNKSI